MDRVPDDKKRGLKTPVWDEYKAIVNKAEGKEVGQPLPPHTLTLYLTHPLLPQVQVELIERFAFYERAKLSFAVVATG